MFNPTRRGASFYLFPPAAPSPPIAPIPIAIAATVMAFATASWSHSQLTASLHHHYLPHDTRYCASARFSPLPSPPRALLLGRSRRVAPTAFCSIPSLPRLGRVGWSRREGNAWLLSFRADTATAPDAALGDPSQALSALLPLVVAATAVAALGNPATFSWCATWPLQEASWVGENLYRHMGAD